MRADDGAPLSAPATEGAAEHPPRVDEARERILAAALEKRLRDLDKLQRESDALRAEIAVRDGYVADLRRRLVDAQEDLTIAERELARLRAADAERVVERYAHYAADESVIRVRVEEAVTRVARLRDHERMEALRALRALLASR